MIQSSSPKQEQAWNYFDIGSDNWRIKLYISRCKRVVENGEWVVTKASTGLLFRGKAGFLSSIPIRDVINLNPRIHFSYNKTKLLFLTFSLPENSNQVYASESASLVKVVQCSFDICDVISVVYSQNSGNFHTSRSVKESGKNIIDQKKKILVLSTCRLMSFKNSFHFERYKFSGNGLKYFYHWKVF